MIQYSKRLNVYYYPISDIYCCGCYFDRVASLLYSSEEFSTPDKFIDKLEKDFPRRKFFVNLLFKRKIVLFCRNMIKFVVKIENENEKLRLKCCVTDFISNGDEIIEVCTICLIKIIENNRLFYHFKRNSGGNRNETDYFFL